jgi:hypothetical protein
LPFSHEADRPKAEAAFGGFCGPDWPGAPFIPGSGKISSKDALRGRRRAKNEEKQRKGASHNPPLSFVGQNRWSISL